MFGKKPKKTNRRVRSAVTPDTAGNRTVFSYHANRSLDAASPKTGRTVKRFWINAAKPSPRQLPKRWLRRIPTTVILLVIGTLFVNNLLVIRKPKVIALGPEQIRQVLLHDQTTYEAAAEVILASSVANTNKLTIDTTAIERRLRQQFPEIERVSVTLPLIGRQSVIYIQPIQPALLLKTIEGGLFVIDASGRAGLRASEVKKIDKLGLVVVEDQTGLPVKLGDNVLPSNNITFITEVVGQLKAKKINITGMTLLKGTHQLDVRVEGKQYVIKFNLGSDARAAVGSYLAVKQYLEREQKLPGSYIDVRVDNRAYYK